MAIWRPSSALLKRVALGVTLVCTSAFILLQFYATSDRFIQDRGNWDTSSVFLFLRGRRTSDLIVRQFTNSSKVPWILDYYEQGHDQLDASNVCPNGGKDLRVLIMVHSAAAYARQRASVRLTWGAQAKRRDVGLGFLVGASQDSRVQQSVEREAHSYGDIIRGRFADTYDNLTLKSLSMLEWVDRRCPEAHFLLKTDDDMFINVDNLLALTDQQLNTTRTIFGNVAHDWKPHRRNDSKWYLSPDIFPPPVLPDFTTGPSYLLTGDVVRDLFEAAMQVKFFKLEDVFVTGILAEMLDIARVRVEGFLNHNTPAVARLDHCALSKKISFHQIGVEDKFSLWWKLFGMSKAC